MARLPTVGDFGARPTPEPQRQIVGYQTPSVGEVMQEASGLVQAGEAIGAYAQKLTEAENAILTREAVVDAAGHLGGFSEDAEKQWSKLSNERDVADLATITEYGAFLRQERDRRLAEHRGTDESRARLAARLEAERATFAIRAGTASMKAGQERVKNILGKNLRAITAEVQDGMPIDEAFKRLDGIIDDMARGIPADEEVAFRSSGRSEITLSKLNSVIERGGYQQAEKIMDENPGLLENLAPPDQRRLHTKIIVSRVAQEKADRELTAKLREFEAIKGAPATPQERTQIAAAAAGITPRQGEKSLSQKVAEFEKQVGRPATEAEIAKMQGAYVAEAGEGGAFGNALTGRALSILTDDAPAFAAGLLSESDERRFLAAVNQYVQPETYLNPDTGVMQTRRPQLPPFARDALARRGVAFEEGGMSAPAQAQQPAPAAAPMSAENQPPTAPASGPQAGTGAPQAAQAPTPQGQPQQPPASAGAAPEADPLPSARQLGGDTIYGLAAKATGPISAVGSALSQTPIVGEFVQTPEITRARTVIPLLKRDLVRVLQNNPRYAVGEMEAIDKEIDISPSMFDTPEAFRQRIIAIDDALEVREQNARATLDAGERVGREERISAMNVLNAIQRFRQLLVPPRVRVGTEEADYGKIPSGTQFVDPEGQLRTKP